VAKFQASGSVPDKTKSEERHTLTKEKVDEIVARLEASLKKSLRQLPLQCGVSNQLRMQQ
jgi:hypothetical protein